MDKIQLNFKSVEDVNKFVSILAKYDGDFDLHCGSYCVDAKSVLGILTMDLRNNMFMTSTCDKQEQMKLYNELTQASVA